MFKTPPKGRKGKEDDDDLIDIDDDTDQPNNNAKPDEEKGEPEKTPQNPEHESNEDDDVEEEDEEGVVEEDEGEGGSSYDSESETSHGEKIGSAQALAEANETIDEDVLGFTLEQNTINTAREVKNLETQVRYTNQPKATTDTRTLRNELNGLIANANERCAIGVAVLDGKHQLALEKISQLRDHLAEDASKILEAAVALKNHYDGLDRATSGKDAHNKGKKHRKALMHTARNLDNHAAQLTRQKGLERRTKRANEADAQNAEQIRIAGERLEQSLRYEEQVRLEDEEDEIEKTRGEDPVVQAALNLNMRFPTPAHPLLPGQRYPNASRFTQPPPPITRPTPPLIPQVNNITTSTPNGAAHRNPGYLATAASSVGTILQQQAAQNTGAPPGGMTTQPPPFIQTNTQRPPPPFSSHSGTANAQKSNPGAPHGAPDPALNGTTNAQRSNPGAPHGAPDPALSVPVRTTTDDPILASSANPGVDGLNDILAAATHATQQTANVASNAMQQLMQQCATLSAQNQQQLLQQSQHQAQFSNPGGSPRTGFFRGGNDTTGAYEPYELEETPEFYDDLPGAWRKRPALKPDRDAGKILGLKTISFSGKQEDYYEFTNTFIPIVHCARQKMAFKTLLLKNALTGGTMQMKQLAKSMAMNAKAYKRTIIYLEQMFGGKDAALTHHIHEITSMAPISKDNLDSLQTFVNTINLYTDTLDYYDMNEQVQTHHMYVITSQKLPDTYRLQYASWVRNQGMITGIETLLTWCGNRVQDMLKTRKPSRPSLTTFPPATKAPTMTSKSLFVAAKDPATSPGALTEHWEEDGDKSLAIVENTKRQPFDKEQEKICDVCAGTHLLTQCAQYRAMEPEDRRKLLAKKERCFRCLRKGHRLNKCDRSTNCHVCGREHHTTIHGSNERHAGYKEKHEKNTAAAVQEERALCIQESADLESRLNDTWSDTEDEQWCGTIEEFCGISSSGTISNRIIACWIMNDDGERFLGNMMLDDGSQPSLLDIRPAQELRLKGHQVDLTLAGVCEQKTSHRTSIVRFWIESIDGTYRRSLQAKVVPNPVGTLRPVNWTEHKDKFEHLRDIDFPDYLDEPVSLLIGNRHTSFSVSLEERPGPGENDPSARRTHMGWTAVGGTQPEPGTDLPSLAEIRDANEAAYAMKLERDYKPLETIYYGEHTRGGSNGCTAEETYVTKAQMRCDEDLNRLLERQYALDTSESDWDAEVSQLTPSEQHALETLKRTRVKLTKGYEYGTLWKEDEPNFPKECRNGRFAEARLKHVEGSKAMQDTFNKEYYHNSFKNWIKKGYVEKVPRAGPDDDVYYLTQFPVVQLHRSTTKIRPVLDGAAKYKGKSLNDAIEIGPNFTNDMTIVINRFRKHSVAVSADVSEMYLKVRLRKEDRKYHHILWREFPSDPIGEYEFTCHPFGDRGSSCVAIYTPKAHVSENSERYPRAAECVLQSTIVDDVLDSVDSVEEAVQLIGDLKLAYDECNMLIRKFCSNKEEVVAHLATEEKATCIDMTNLRLNLTDNTPVTKALGLIWSSEEDNFTYRMEAPPTPESGIWTKRMLCSLHSSLYDLQGFISPFVAYGKKLTQECWRQGKGWDDPIPEDVLPKWILWLESLPELVNIRIPRCLKGEYYGKEVENQRIYTFSDASQEAYGCVSYMVTEYTDGVLRSIIITGKARVTPLQYRSIPRLELMAALLAARSARHANKAFGFPLERMVFFADSTNVLYWLESCSRDLKTFVANRVAEIQEITRPSSWKWVGTEDNPADLASRGALMDALGPTSIWWNGPKWMTDTSAKFPERPYPDEEEKGRGNAEFKPALLKKNIEREEKIEEVAFSVHEEEAEEELQQLRDGYFTISTDKFHPDNISSWRTLVSVRTAIIIWQKRVLYRKAAEKQGIKLGKGKETRDKSGKRPTISDFGTRQEAKKQLLLSTQAECLSATLAQLRKRDRVLISNPFRFIRPAIQKETGLVRVFSRLRHAKHMSFESKCPILLHKSHPSVMRIVREIHENELHHVGGQNQVLARFEQEYWCTGVREKIKKFVRNCVTCRRINAAPLHQEMAPLIDQRFIPEAERIKAFSYVGLDIAGPYFTKHGRGIARKKRWMLLFTDTSTRGVHLEMLDSMTLESFLMALDRFVATRGKPVRIYSDNGTNIVGAINELRRLWTLLEESDLPMLRPNIEWRFNSPSAPHTGGVFERMIQAAKRALYRVMPVAELTDEELRTAIKIAEGLLNARPITYVGTVEDPEPLTLSHFMGTSAYEKLATLPPDTSLRQRWKRIQELMDSFWKRFIQEYVPSLNKMAKWHKEQPDLQVGDVCYLLEERERGKYPLARVTAVYKNPHDGHHRNVEILTGGRTLRRPSFSVVLLPRQED